MNENSSASNYCDFTKRKAGHFPPLYVIQPKPFYGIQSEKLLLTAFFQLSTII